MFFKYLYYRMYLAYQAKNDDPKLRSFVYLLLLKTSLAFMLFLYTTGILERMRFNAFASAMHSRTFLIVSGVFLLTYSYLAYGRLPFAHYENLFRNHEKLNKYVKLWMIIVLPFLILFGAIDFYVRLFGGQSFGKPVIGWLNQ